MRALWAFVVVCLMAAHGVPSARAAGRGGDPIERVQRADHPALPAVTTARSASLWIATRPQLAGLAAAAPPALPRCSRVRIVEAPPRVEHACAVLVAIRSARGPPGR